MRRSSPAWLTARGAAWGMIAGATVATSAIFLDLALGEPGGVRGALLAQAAVISVPIAFATMIGVSLRAGEHPRVEAEMLALHAPEGLGFDEREHVPFPLGPSPRPTLGAADRGPT